MVISRQLVLTADERRIMDRGHALSQVLGLTAGIDGISHRGERDIRAAALSHIEPILHLADSATVALLELQAIDRRLDVHVREQHIGCTTSQPCPGYRVLQIRRRRLQAAYDQAYRDLVRGRR